MGLSKAGRLALTGLREDEANEGVTLSYAQQLLLGALTHIEGCDDCNDLADYTQMAVRCEEGRRLFEAAEIASRAAPGE